MQKIDECEVLGCIGKRTHYAKSRTRDYPSYFVCERHAHETNSFYYEVKPLERG